MAFYVSKSRFLNQFRKVFPKSFEYINRNTYRKCDSMCGMYWQNELPLNHQGVCLLDSNIVYCKQRMICNPSFHYKIVCKHRRRQIFVLFHSLHRSPPDFRQNLYSHNPLWNEFRNLIHDLSCLVDPIWAWKECISFTPIHRYLAYDRWWSCGRIWMQDLESVWSMNQTSTHNVDLPILCRMPGHGFLIQRCCSQLIHYPQHRYTGSYTLEPGVHCRED